MTEKIIRELPEEINTKLRDISQFLIDSGTTHFIKRFSDGAEIRIELAGFEDLIEKLHPAAGYCVHFFRMVNMRLIPMEPQHVMDLTEAGVMITLDDVPSGDQILMNWEPMNQQYKGYDDYWKGTTELSNSVYAKAHPVSKKCPRWQW